VGETVKPINYVTLVREDNPCSSDWEIAGGSIEIGCLTEIREHTKSLFQVSYLPDQIRFTV
jgi:hypothetical protein